MQNTRSRQQLRAVMRLRELVLAGGFKAGERISELAAVDMLGMSRTPVRLALTTLAHEGLLDPLPKGGFILRDFSIADVFDAIDLRGVLEGTAARMAAERSKGASATASLKRTVTEIDALLAEETRGDEVFERYFGLNEEFHDELLRLAKCPILERNLALVTALPFASPNAFVRIQGKYPRSRETLTQAQFQHHSIADAIEAGDAARAFALGQEHARLASANLREALKQDELLGGVLGSQLIRRADGAAKS